MARSGFTTMSIDIELGEALDKISKDQFCRTRPEAIRRLVKIYRDTETLKKDNHKPNDSPPLALEAVVNGVGSFSENAVSPRKVSGQEG